MSMHDAITTLIMAALAGTFNLAAATPENLSGDLSVHDPSRIVRCGENYWLFATGNGILSRHSKDLVHWEAGPRIFTNRPAWTIEAVPGFRGHCWAPDVIRLGDRFGVYFSVSTWGSQTSAIGLVTNPTLDPADPAYGWTDHGIVIRSSPEDNFNAIDPAIFRDRDNSLWMAFGSFWSGIKVVQLNPTTGLRIALDSPITALAWKSAIEAPALTRHGDFYYLFVNWDQCCRGTNSTYNIRVGRSITIHGPYLDRDGLELLTGGGSLVLKTEGRYIGPGHVSFVTHEKREFMAHHYYDGERGGAKTLGLRPLYWDEQGWPTIALPQKP